MKANLQRSSLRAQRRLLQLKQSLGSMVVCLPSIDSTVCIMEETHYG
jgi:hypothetical protein